MNVRWPLDQQQDSQRVIVTALRQYMRICHGSNGLVIFTDCLAEARRQFNREVREAADATPLTK